MKSQTSNSKKRKNIFSKIQQSYYKPEIYAFIGVIILGAILSVASPYFFNFNNLVNLLRQISLNEIVATGVTFVILTGDIDLSVGSIVAVSGTLFAGFIINMGLPVWISIILGLGVGTAFGLLNGIIVAYTRVPAIIVTLGMMTIARGSALLYSGGYPITGLPESVEFIGRGYIGPIPVPVVIMGLILIIGGIVLTQTKFGRYIYALGGNAETVRLAGISVKKIKIKIFMISGFLSAVSGLIVAARLSSGQPSAAQGWELTAIAATVVGGTSIMGGRGTVVGTLIGAVIIGTITNGLNLMNVSPYMQEVVRGAVIIIAVLVRSGLAKK
ncbi:MAG: ABC transporter permease [bacterium]